MQVSYFLNKVGNALYFAGVKLTFTGNNISGVYLIGQWLANPFYVVGSNVIGAGVNILQASLYFEQFANQVLGGAVTNPVLSALLYYANQLINFITNPVALITSVINSAFGFVNFMYYNTYSFIFPHVIRILDTYLSWWRDIGSAVRSMMSVVIYDFGTFSTNPARWVIDRITAYSGVLGSLMRDPNGWLRDTIKILFPDLWAFMQNPTVYIMDKFADGLEVFFDRYLSRILKVVENVLSAIF